MDRITVLGFPGPGIDENLTAFLQYRTDRPVKEPNYGFFNAFDPFEISDLQFFALTLRPEQGLIFVSHVRSFSI
jgi:hypothetical protein